jgi:hypothetical protein
MREIWKYELVPHVVLQMPKRAQLLAVQVQHGRAQLWALVDPKASLVRRHVGIYGTGHPVPADAGFYVGTFQLEDGTLVFHVFDEGESHA